MSASLSCNFFSQALNINTSMNVILPVTADDGRDFPTLYLLHGYTDDQNSWTRWTSIERYVQQYRLAVVMPDVQKSWYNDFPCIEKGYRYWTYVTEELIQVTRKLFHLSDKREDTFVAGLSMGGFGAFKCALNRPDVFSAAGSLSGALFRLEDIQTRKDTGELQMAFGYPTTPIDPTNDLYAAAERTAKLSDKPKLYQYCGTDDFLYEHNQRFKGFVSKLEYDYTYEESPGDHQWIYWDRYIEKFLHMLDLEKLP